MFRPATREQSRLRLTVDGPAGSGKTFSALRFAHALVDAFGGKIAFIDTEHGSASKYVGECPDGIPWVFDILKLVTFSPEKYIQAIEAAGRMGYTVLIIDSLSHAWEGKGGALEIKQKVGDSWSAWRHVTPIHNRMIDAILQSPCHIITTMRSRMEYIQETDERGKVVIHKVGLAPVQRPGAEYELDIVCDINWAHIMTVSKSRCSAVADMTVERPGPEFMRPVIEWLTTGVSHQVENMPVSADPVITLDDLLLLYDADTILTANNGQIPVTDEELAAITAKLLKLAV